ncbi:MAG: alkaline phosphatase family protein [Sphingomonadales bacterium]|nr:alkaline phosphatase family protein [Sphingomonadales bacterium]
MRPFLAPAVLALSLALAGCAATSARPSRQAAAVAPAPTAPPKLVVAIAIDQFSADSFAQFRQRYTGGLARLQQGAVFPSAFQSHAATETCPGHSTLLTGARPSRTGIIANMWFAPEIARADKRIYCAEDESDPASTSREPVVSAVHLKVPTLGERMKAANPASRNVAVSAKDRAVMMMGGHQIDEGYWWKNGAFVTLAGRPLAPAAVAENAAIASRLKAGEPGYALPAWCTGFDHAVQAGPVSIGTGRFAMEPNKPDQFRVSPRMDAATVDLAVRLVDALQLGKQQAPDLLSVSLSANDYIGHAVGSEGAEMCIQMAALDRLLGEFLGKLDARGLDYIVVLSADHGGLDTPERLAQQALPRATRADAALLPAALAKAVTAKTGIATTGPLLFADGPFGDYYVARSLPSADRARVVAALVPLLRAHPQVAAAFTADELASAPLPVGSPQDWTLKERARASFDPQRSGDVVVLLDRAVVPIPSPAPGYTATHGSAWDYDRRVPLLFWRKGLPALEQPAPVETVDIAPTLAAVLGLGVPEGAFDGRCLDIDGSAANSCARK